MYLLYYLQIVLKVFLLNLYDFIQIFTYLLLFFLPNCPIFARTLLTKKLEKSNYSTYTLLKKKIKSFYTVIYFLF